MPWNSWRRVNQTIKELIIFLLYNLVPFVPVYAGYSSQILCYLCEFLCFAKYSWTRWSLYFADSLNQLFIIFLNILLYIYSYLLILLFKSALRLFIFHYLFWSSKILLAFTRLIKCRLCAYVLSRIPSLYFEFLMFHKLVCILYFFDSKIIIN